MLNCCSENCDVSSAESRNDGEAHKSESPLMSVNESVKISMDNRNLIKILVENKFVAALVDIGPTFY